LHVDVLPGELDAHPGAGCGARNGLSDPPVAQLGQPMFVLCSHSSKINDKPNYWTVLPSLRITFSPA
jgi:hypothetical protein